jgi:hypothetical protein
VQQGHARLPPAQVQGCAIPDAVSVNTIAIAITITINLPPHLVQVIPRHHLNILDLPLILAPQVALHLQLSVVLQAVAGCGQWATGKQAAAMVQC